MATKLHQKFQYTLLMNLIWIYVIPAVSDIFNYTVARHRVVAGLRGDFRSRNHTQADGFATAVFPSDGVGWTAKQEQQEW